jgi:hypothetical protein
MPSHRETFFLVTASAQIYFAIDFVAQICPFGGKHHHHFERPFAFQCCSRTTPLNLVLRGDADMFQILA